MGRDVHSLMLSIQHFLCTLKDGFGEAVVACDMPKPCKFPSLDSCQKRFLWTHKELYLGPHPVGGLVLQVRDADKFPQALGFESLGLFFFPFFFQVSKKGPCLTAKEEDGDDKTCTA